MREWGHIFNCQYFLGEIRSLDHPAIKGANQRKKPFSEIDRTLSFLEEDSLLTIEDVTPKHIEVKGIAGDSGTVLLTPGAGSGNYEKSGTVLTRLTRFLEIRVRS